MEVIHLQGPIKNEFPPLALAIGFFDGIHIGHQTVIQTAKRKGDQEGWKSAVMFFNPSPKEILGKDPKSVKYITLLDEKIQLIQEMGIDYCFIVPFTKEFAGKLPEEFVEEYLISLNVKHLVAGFDFTYGKFGKGNMETLKEHSKGKFTQSTIEQVSKDDEKISSTLIRHLIQSGKTHQVPEYLGRFFTMKGKVVPGHKRGRELGFPTANLEIDQRYVHPANGVYSARLYVSGRWVNGVLNIGTNPTFNEGTQEKFIEIYLFDFNEEIYGEHVILEWHKKQRDELKFDHVEDLIHQMKQDEIIAREYFRKFVNS